jgi:RNA polymerase sigma-70 factor, ECF subfamily
MQLSDLEDNTLVSKYIKGNGAALETLILRHKSKVFTSILILVKDKELAEDVFQETFIKVIKTLQKGNYQEEGKFLPWVVRIAHNLVIDHFRKSKRMPMVRDTDEFCITSTLRLNEDNIEDQLVKDRIKEQVQQLVDLLPLEQREVVVMRHFAGMSFKDIASCTGVSINTSLGRMRYALINLRKIIAEKNLVLLK